VVGRTEISQTSFAGSRVLITSGEFAGAEGICLGKTEDPSLRAVLPDGFADVIALLFEKDFGLVVDLSSDPGRN
jgi:hypothetical protein